MNAFIFFAILIILFDYVENKKLQKSFEEIFGDGWHLKEMGEEGEEKEEEANLAQIMAQENKEKRSGGRQSNHHSVINETDQNEEEENGENDQQQKREIICKFRAIKEKIKQKKGKQSRKEWNKIDRVLAKKLGTNRNYIYKWTKEFGMGQKITNEGRMALMMKYWEMKRNDPKMSEEKIAKALKISRNTIIKWRSQFGELGMEMKKEFIVTEEQKRKIVAEFRAIKERIRQTGRKYSKEQWHKIEIMLAKKLGTNQNYVYRWISELGMGQKMTNEQRMTLMRQYCEMKRNEPKMSDAKIAKALKVSRQSISKWKRQFGGEEETF